MSQRQAETILLQVPKTFSDADIEQFKKLLIHATSHTNWENLTIIVTNRTFSPLPISTATYDEIRKLQEKGKRVQIDSGRRDTGRTDEYSNETPEKDAADYKKDNEFIKFRKDGDSGNPRNKKLK